MFDIKKVFNQTVHQVKETGKGLVNGATDLAKDAAKTATKEASQVVDFSKSVFEEASSQAKKVVTDPADFARDAGRETLRLAYNGANKLLPKGSVPFALKATEAAIDAVAAPIVAVAGKKSGVGKFAYDISRIDLETITRTDGLKGDWGKLWEVWLLEEKPASLGKWDKTTIDGHQVDRVTITDPKYTGDLASRETQKEAEAAFLKAYPNPKPGDELINAGKFIYTGNGTAEGGKYTALESFMGSYSTDVKCVGTDKATGKPILEFSVRNESHWESGTRVPATGKNVGIDQPYLVEDRPRDSKIGLGGDFCQRFVWQQVAQ